MWPFTLLGQPCRRLCHGQCLQELAAHCDQDPACHSFAYTEQYRDNLGPSLGYFKGHLDPNQTVLHQGAILYVKDPTTAGEQSRCSLWLCLVGGYVTAKCVSYC